MKLGIELLLKDKKLISHLKGRRVGLVGHPASVDKSLKHSIDLLVENGIKLTCAFGPQHGLRGEKQDNMIESDNFIDPKYNIPIFSLYGEVRRPTAKMLEHFDVLLFDLQDVGCRIYTFLTTLFYLMEDCAKSKKAIWVLDRPNPAGRPIEGNYLQKNFFSFVGAAEIVMRHGLTLGEAGLWYKSYKKLDLEFKVIKMNGYNINSAPEFGWPASELSWVNPSPNIPQISTARMYAGTVLIEGTKLSEGRGTTRPLEVIATPVIGGAENKSLMINNELWIKEINKLIPQYLKNLIIRPCYFEPCFQKHAKKLCTGIQLHIDIKKYNHANFKPYRIVAAALKTLKKISPQYDLWLSPPYEYERSNMPIDILSGSSFLREWVDNPSAGWNDFEKYLSIDEKKWQIERKPFLLY